MTTSPVRRLIGAELTLMRRDPMTLTFVFAFPVLTMLIVGGAFGTKPNEGFAWTNPAHWYVASYFTVVIAAMGLIMLPVHLASYRERGVLRRFGVAGFPRWSFPLAQLVTGVVAVVAASAVLLAVAAPVYGIPTPQHWGRVVAAVVLGTMAFTSIGVLLGTILPSARSAQATGLLLFFPSFLLGAGGPPPHAMGATLRSIRGYLPLTWLTDAIRAPWLGIGSATGSLMLVAVIAVGATALAMRRSAL